MRSFVALATLAGLASAHFKLKYPPTVGFEDEKEATAPCGGFTPDLDGKLADFHIGGDAVAVRLSHPQCNWLYRVTTEPSDDKSWEQIYPIVMQNGLGDFCIPQLTVPEKYEGKKGVISIVSSAVDGLLYQVRRRLPQCCEKRQKEKLEGREGERNIQKPRIKKKRKNNTDPSAV